jgi:hypothetical protein
VVVSTKELFKITNFKVLQTKISELEGHSHHQKLQTKIAQLEVDRLHLLRKSYKAELTKKRLMLDDSNKLLRGALPRIDCDNSDDSNLISSIGDYLYKNDNQFLEESC